jgi:hypothetical protein
MTIGAKTAGTMKHSADTELKASSVFAERYPALQPRMAWSQTFPELQAFDVYSILPPIKAMHPNDKQTNGSGSCFVMAAVIVHHHLQHQGLIVPGDQKETVIKQKLQINNDSLLSGGSPSKALKELVGVVASVPFSKYEIERTLIGRVCGPDGIPGVLPWLPPISTSERVHVVSPEEYVVALEPHLRSLSALTTLATSKKRRQSDPDLLAEFKANGGTPPMFHSQAVVGVALEKATGSLFWLCRQTWIHCDLTLIPALPSTAFKNLLQDPALYPLFQELHVMLVPSGEPVDVHLSPASIAMASIPAYYSSCVMELETGPC